MNRHIYMCVYVQINTDRYNLNTTFTSGLPSFWNFHNKRLSFQTHTVFWNNYQTFWICFFQWSIKKKINNKYYCASDGKYGTTGELLRRSIWWELWDNFLQFSIKIYIVVTHKKGFSEVLLMSTHKICLYGEITKIIPELSPNTPQQLLWYHNNPKYKYWDSQAIANSVYQDTVECTIWSRSTLFSTSTNSRMGYFKF